MWKLHFLFIGPKSAKFQALLILQKEIYIFIAQQPGKYSTRGTLSSAVHNTLRHYTALAHFLQLRHSQTKR